MMRNFIWITVFGAVACASGAQQRLARQPEAAPAPAPSPATDEPRQARQPATEPAPAPVSAPSTRTAPPAAAASEPQRPRQVDTPDSLEEAFLDSLRSASADTASRVQASVSREAVREEARTLFGRQGGGPTWDIDVISYQSHERVQYWIEWFSGRARWHFARYLERLGRYDSMIRHRLAAAGLPQDMIYLAMIESGFSHSVRSRAGAVGLWQFIPQTARRYGLTVDAWVDDRRDPYRSTDAAIRFLSELNNRFGSLYLAAAAYNGGPGRVISGLRRYDVSHATGDAQFFALADETAAFRRETRDYVPKLIAAALMAKEPERYGFTGLERWEPLRYDSVEVSFSVGIDVLARLAGTTREVMEDMNARFHRGVTPPDRRVWVRVPVGTADSVAARLEVLPARERVTLLYHTVERGETLSRIARRYGVSVEDLRTANRVGALIRRGQRLVIPMSLARTSEPAAASRRTARSAAPRLAARAPSATNGRGAVRRVHIVRPGETLSEIAEDFNVPLSRLLEANGLGRRSLIRPGQAIRIPSR